MIVGIGKLFDVDCDVEVVCDEIDYVVVCD